VHDVTAVNAIIRFDASLAKKYEQQLEGFDEDEYRKHEELTELFEFLDDIIPDDDDIDLLEPRRRGRKRCVLLETSY
jgi:condensin complex subunit 3